MKKPLKKMIPKLTEVKIKNFTAEELKMISELKIIVNEKTAAGMFKKILQVYSMTIEKVKRLDEMQRKYFELINSINKIVIIIQDENK